MQSASKLSGSLGLPKAFLGFLAQGPALVLMAHIRETGQAPSIPHQSQVHRTIETLPTLRHLHWLDLTDARMWDLYTSEVDRSDAMEMPQPLSEMHSIGCHPGRLHHYEFPS